MASYIVLQFSTVKQRGAATVVSPQRAKEPSAEKICLPFVTVLVPTRATSTSSAGSPTKRIKSTEDENVEPERNFETQLGSSDLVKNLAKSSKIELEYELVAGGRASGPPRGDFSELLNFFPTTKAAEVLPPFLVFRVQQLPPKPWPFTIGGLPVRFCTNESIDPFNRGRLGRGPKCLKDIDLQRSSDYSEKILKQAVGAIRGQGFQW